MSDDDGSTEGLASFTANDFDADVNGNISLDYTNGQKATTSTIGFLTDTDWDTFNGKVNVTGTPVDNQLSIWTGANTIEGDTAVTWNGTSFTIDKNGTTPEVAVINDGGTGGAQFKMKDNASGVDFRFKATAAGGFKIRDHQYTMDVISIASDSKANSIVIDADGDVGLGTATPGAVLDVNGTSRLTGSVTANGAFNYAADAQASDTYVITLAPAATAYTAGMYICFKANTINTGPATVNVNGLGAQTIVKRVSTALANGDILAGMLCLIIYDGTNFVLMNPIVN